MATDAPPAPIAAAALLGLAGGIRSTAPVAALVLSRRLPWEGAARAGVLAATAGEAVADKLVPFLPPRTSPPALGGRLASGAFAGHRLAGVAGAVAGAAGAAATSFGATYARRALTKGAGLPDVAVALGEDAVTAGLAVLGTRLARA